MPSKYPKLLDSDIVYRALRKSWLIPDIWELTPDAFFLREKEKGLSTNIPAYCTKEQCINNLRNSNALVILNVGLIRKLGEGLDLVLNVCQDGYNHASIKGLPCKEDDEELATKIAEELIKQSNIEIFDLVSKTFKPI